MRARTCHSWRNRLFRMFSSLKCINYWSPSMLQLDLCTCLIFVRYQLLSNYCPKFSQSLPNTSWRRSERLTISHVPYRNLFASSTIPTDTCTTETNCDLARDVFVIRRQLLLHHPYPRNNLAYIISSLCKPSLNFTHILWSNCARMDTITLIKIFWNTPQSVQVLQTL